jgi:hypothetical protein
MSNPIYKKIESLNDLPPEEDLVTEHRYPCGCLSRMYQASEVLRYCGKGADCPTAQQWMSERRIR